MKGGEVAAPPLLNPPPSVASGKAKEGGGKWKGDGYPTLLHRGRLQRTCEGKQGEARGKTVRCEVRKRSLPPSLRTLTPRAKPSTMGLGRQHTAHFFPLVRTDATVGRQTNVTYTNKGRERARERRYTDRQRRQCPSPGHLLRSPCQNCRGESECACAGLPAAVPMRSPLRGAAPLLR